MQSTMPPPGTTYAPRAQPLYSYPNRSLLTGSFVPDFFIRLRAIIYAVICGFKDSVFGAIKVFKVDLQDIRRVKSLVDASNQAKRESLLRRGESADRSRGTTPVPARNTEDNMNAKRRAIERRQQQQSGPKQQQPLKATVQVKREQTSNKQSILYRTLQSGALNGVLFLSSIFLFQQLLEPMLLGVLEKLVPEAQLRVFTHYVFSACWAVPVFILTKLTNILWFQDIADLAFSSENGHRRSMASISVSLADNILAVLMELLFLVQGSLWVLDPVRDLGLGPLGVVIHLAHVALLNALYAFEYQWYNQGIELFRRLDYLERNWAYFTGFGLPLALITYGLESAFVSAGLFAVLFPFFLVSAHTAQVIPHDCGAEPLQLHFFKPVSVFSNLVLSWTMPAKNKVVPPPPSTPGYNRRVNGGSRTQR